MSETLEAMARATFKAWFVDFEPVRTKMEGRWQRGVGADGRPPLQPGLPAHPACACLCVARRQAAGAAGRLYDLFPDRLVESELGEIPEGWRVSKVRNCCEHIQNGGTPRRNGAAILARRQCPLAHVRRSSSIY